MKAIIILFWIALLNLALPTFAVLEDEEGVIGTMEVVTSSLTCATADFCENFEDAITTCGSAPCWTLIDPDTNINTADNTAEKNGTYGMSLDLDGATANMDANVYVRFTHAAERTEKVIGFWRYIPTLTDTSYSMTVLWATGDSNANPYNLQLAMSVVTSGSTLAKFTIVGASTSSSINVAPGAWYFFSIDYVLNSTSTLKIYNASGTLQGTVTATASNNAGAVYIYDFFGWSVFTADPAEDIDHFIDDAIIDWTHLTYPILPTS